MRRVLVISPHFPPDATAGAHRVRVLAPYLEGNGWRPTVLTVDPRDYEGTLDEELGARVPAELDVVRCRAWSTRRTRRLGLGDLGLRSLTALWRESRAIASDVRPQAVYITTYPIYPATIGPRLRRTLGIPFVLDLQDPWVGAWGDTVGGGARGGVDLKSRLSRIVARRMERHVVPQADGLTGVSTSLLDELASRYPVMASRPRAVLPIGIDPGDMAWARADVHAHERAAPWLPPRDGRLHICYVGTALPLGHDVLRALFAAVARLRAAQPALAARLRLHFVGTSNEARADAAPRVHRLAVEAGIPELVHEHAPRVPFFEALRVLDRAGVILLAGTSEARYTASKLHAALAAGRPVLAVFHGASDVSRALATLAAREPAICVLTYDDQAPVDVLVDRLAALLAQWVVTPPPAPARDVLPADAQAPALAGRLAALLNRVVEGHG